MNILKPSHRIVRCTEGGIAAIEQAARTCYLSEPLDNKELREEFNESPGILGMDTSTELREKHFQQFVRNKFINKLRKMGHQTPFEFMDIEIEFICDRGVSHELVRHRMTSPMQESTRYCNYQEDGKHGMNVIEPLFFDADEKRIDCEIYVDGLGNAIDTYTINKFDIWHLAMTHAETFYNQLLKMGATPQEARSVLPNSLKTKLKIKANVREWWHIFKLRALNTGAHPQCRELMIPALQDCAAHWPTLFEWMLADLDTDLNKPARPKDGT